MYLSTQDYSERTKRALNFFFAHDNSTRFVIIRRHGWEAARNLECYFLKKHQETHFIDGATKLGIMNEPHPVLCAKYHCLSNWLGGIDMGFYDDYRNSGKAYVSYMTPDCSIGSPFLPSPATWTVPMEMMIAIYTWHARNGKFLNNDRLYFCLTDHVQAGGPYHMGYFAEDDHALEPWERLRFEPGTATIEPGPPPDLSDEWPLARREAALEKYNGEYVLGGFAQTALMLGEDESIAIAERSHFANVVQWVRPFTVDLGWTGDTPVTRYADLFCKIWGLIGDKFDVHTENGDVFVENTKTRLYTPQYVGWEYPPRRLEEAFARAWTAASRAVGPGVEVSVVKSRMDGDEHTIWRFRQTDHSAFIGGPGEYDAVVTHARELMTNYWEKDPVVASVL